MARRGRDVALARISSIYTHVGGTRRWRRLSRRYFGFPYSGVSALFLQSSPFPPHFLLYLEPPAYYYTTPGSKRLDGLSPLYFRTGLNHRRGFLAVFAADEKGSGLYLARRTLPPLPRLFRSALPAIPLILLWNYDDGAMCARGCGIGREKRPP